MKKSSDISMTVLLVTAIGGLVVLAAGSVLLLSAYANFKNTSELALSRGQIFMATLKEDVKQHVQPVSDIVEFLVRQAADGEFDPAFKDETVWQLKGIMGSIPQISDVAVWRPNAREIIVTRGADQKLIVQTDDNQNDEIVKSYLRMLRNNREMVWIEPFISEGKTLMTVAAPLFYESKYIGTMAAGVSVGELSELIEELGNTYQTNGFIIYGNDHLLAHKKLPELSRAKLDYENPLFKVSDLDMPILGKMLITPIDFSDPDGVFDAREIDVNGDEYLVLSSEINDFGYVPWTLGAYSPSTDWNAQIYRLLNSIIGGAILLVLAVIGAIFLSRWVAAPISKAADATKKVGNLNLDEIDPLPPSRISELNNQAIAFNQMLEGLRWFETYVPRKLVRRLIQQKENSSISSQELELTVMFTDIVGFTASSEAKQPGEIAQELNQHFEIINQCIEKEGGTLDKYIGDSAMAFWGAPETQPDHARRACRAAIAIEKALSAEGHKQRIKIAIHTGPLIVGNIGAVGRMNYTVIGDTVNTCSRIEKLASDLLDDGSSAVIVISEATANHLDNEFTLQKAGKFSVKGRKEEITAFRLLTTSNSN
ncbi:MAG: adenylate/guanylate cyclase domain-containing protein [Rhodobacteraceae bacterium]|nr:adenylate/guanylate cyclase domain-containing protein [Paracoccaceae bacterium]